MIFDIFEDIEMSTHAQKGNEIRDYFIKLHKFINYYKNNIYKMIWNPSEPEKFAYIIMIDEKKNLNKPGKTKTNFRKRLKTYFTGSAMHLDVKFIMKVSDPDIVEKCINLMLSKNKFKGRK